MTMPTLLATLAPYLGWGVLALLVLLQPVWILIGRQHPLRILNHALTGTFYLLLAGLLVPLAGAMTVIWWMLAALMIAAVVVALARSRVVSPGADASPVRQATAGGAGSGREGRAGRAERRTVLRATRPSTPELVITGGLAVGAAALMLIAG